MFYQLSRPLLFCLEPEQAHDFSLKTWRWLHRHSGFGFGRSLPTKSDAATTPCQVMGIDFPNRVGLAAGLDKNADYVDALAAFGFGFIEVGTVTPRPQPGNPRPRLFRLTPAQALINRMGFNNHGVDYLLEQVQQTKFSGVLGINIGKNFDTPVERAVDDYLIGLQKVYAHADYVTINISSPNTPGLRELQYGDALQRLLEPLKQQQNRLATEHQRYLPMTVKVAPDLDEKAVEIIASTLLQYEIDGLIATNTTASRAGVEGLKHADESGGLSGAPLTTHSTAIIRQFHQVLGERLPIIAVGGIMNGADARAKFDAGASLVQLYSGLIYRGPGLVNEVKRALS